MKSQMSASRCYQYDYMYIKSTDIADEIAGDKLVKRNYFLASIFNTLHWNVKLLSNVQQESDITCSIKIYSVGSHYLRRPCAEVASTWHPIYSSPSMVKFSTVWRVYGTYLLNKKWKSSIISYILRIPWKAFDQISRLTFMYFV